MEKEKKRLNINILSWILAAVIAVCFVVSIFSSIKNYNSKTYDVLILGDSIIGKERLFTTIDSRIAEITGKTVYNGAFGGSCASTANKENRYDYHEDSLNLCRIVEAVCTQDLGVQLADLPNNQFSTWYFQDAMTEMSKIDFSKVDVILLQHGVNDYGAGRPLDNPKDKKDVYTYGGALRYSIERIQETYPDMKIVLITPAFCWIPDCEPCDRQDFGMGTLEAYANKAIEIAKEYELDIMDVYHGVDFNEENIIGYTEDGMHLNETGREIYGDFLGHELQKILAEEK